MRRGFLIAIEGIDGAGKTTNARRLVRWLKRMGVQARYTSEPTKGVVGRILEKMASGRRVDVRVEALLFAADRIDHLNRIVRPHLEKGYVVVSDRYVHSSIAYQSITVGDQRWVKELNRFAEKPDLVILLDADPETGLRRIKRRRARFERVEILEKVRRKYLELAEREGFKIIDANRRIKEVFEEVKSLVKEFLEENGVLKQ